MKVVGSDTGIRKGEAPVVSVVTATYNCLELTKAFLKSLEDTWPRESIPSEVILVDDASVDGTASFLRTLPSSRYRVFFQQENQGFARTNNFGAQQARGEFLVFLNNDLVLTPGWLQPMLDGLKCLPKAGVVGNVQVDPRTGLIDHAGVFFDRNGLPAHARKQRRRPPREPYREWYAVTAACMIIRRDLFLEAGGFDEVYRNGTEDIDLCVRLHEQGFRHYVSNRSVVLHHVSSSPGRRDHDRRNMEIFRERWSHLTVEWGKREWAVEYLRRYARRWWRFNFWKFWRAVWLIVSQPSGRIGP